MKIKSKTLTAALLAAGLLCISGVSCLAPLIPEPEVTYKDGTYTGTGQGMMGEMRVEVTIANGAMTKIVLKEHSETSGKYQKAEKTVIESILQQETTDVDAVSGATETSDGIKQAVEDALKQAEK